MRTRIFIIENRLKNYFSFLVREKANSRNIFFFNIKMAIILPYIILNMSFTRISFYYFVSYKD